MNVQYRWLKKALVIIFLLHMTIVEAKIIKTADIKSIEEEVLSLDQNAIVAFDVKGVLMVPQDLIISPYYRAEYKKIIKELQAKYPNSEELANILSIILLSHKPILVDEYMPSFVRKINEKNIKTMVVTSGRTGRFGKIEKLEDLRINTLKELGFNFSHSFAKYPTIYLTHIENSNIKSPPIFKDGVLLASRMSKGEVLKEFLKEINFKPSTLVFVDNDLKKIHSVESFCKEAGINFIGVHYVKIYEKPVKALSQKVVDLQFATLRSKGIWLTDDKAICLLEKQEGKSSSEVCHNVK